MNPSGLSAHVSQTVTMPPPKTYETTTIVRCETSGAQETINDLVSIEQPLEIRIRGESIAVTMRTPGHDHELAAGFAVSEGIVSNATQVVDIEHCRRNKAEHPENIINIFLDSNTSCDLKRLSRHVFASSSCGVCGKASIEAIRQNFPAVHSNLAIQAATLRTLPQRLRLGQSDFTKTGGLHAAGIFTEDGALLCVREDVGRHNAVDKVIGWSLLNDHFPLDHHLLIVSSRASFEIMQKALIARVPFVAAISAPSSLAVEFAQENQQTLVGFLRESAFNIYSHPQRVQDS